MQKILGSLIIVACVLGGYALANGELAMLWQPAVSSSVPARVAVVSRRTSLPGARMGTGWPMLSTPCKLVAINVHNWERCVVCAVHGWYIPR